MTERMKILIGYDGSDCAEAALDDLKRAGLPESAEAHILSIAEVWLPPPPPSSYEIVEQAREVKVPADLKRVYTRASTAVKEAQAAAERARNGMCLPRLAPAHLPGSWSSRRIIGNPI